MNKKRLKAYLGTALYIKREIDRLEEHIKTLSCLREKVTPTYSLVPGSGGGFGNKIEDLTVKIIELEAQSRKCIGEYLQQYNNISKIISSLKEADMRYVTILGLRYLEGNEWDEIAEAVHYSRRMVNYLHEKAIDELCKREDLLNENEMPKMRERFSEKQNVLDA